MGLGQREISEASLRRRARHSTLDAIDLQFAPRSDLLHRSAASRASVLQTNLRSVFGLAVRAIGNKWLFGDFQLDTIEERVARLDIKCKLQTHRLDAGKLTDNQMHLLDFRWGILLLPPVFDCKN